MENYVVDVAISIEIGTPLAGLRDSEGHEIALDLKEVTLDLKISGGSQANVRCHARRGIPDMENTVVGIAVSIEIGTPV